jgi:hypothetical protein
MCHECPRTFDRPHQVLAHYWYTHIKQELLSSLSNFEKVRLEALADDFAWHIALVDEFIEPINTVPDTSSDTVPGAVRLLIAAFAHWFNVDLYDNTEPYSRIPDPQKSLQTVFQVIAPVTGKKIVQ